MESLLIAFQMDANIPVNVKKESLMGKEHLLFLMEPNIQASLWMDLFAGLLWLPFLMGGHTLGLLVLELLMVRVS